MSASLSDPRIKEGEETRGRRAGGVARGETMCAGDEFRDSRGECRGDILGDSPSREATLPLSLGRKEEHSCYCCEIEVKISYLLTAEYVLFTSNASLFLKRLVTLLITHLRCLGLELGESPTSPSTPGSLPSHSSPETQRSKVKKYRIAKSRHN